MGKKNRWLHFFAGKQEDHSSLGKLKELPFVEKIWERKKLTLRLCYIQFYYSIEISTLQGKRA